MPRKPRPSSAGCAFGNSRNPAQDPMKVLQAAPARPKSWSAIPTIPVCRWTRSTQLYIPPFFVNDLRVLQDDSLILKMERAAFRFRRTRTSQLQPMSRTAPGAFAPSQGTPTGICSKAGWRAGRFGDLRRPRFGQMAGHRRAEAMPSFGRLWPGHDETLRNTAPLRLRLWARRKSFKALFACSEERNWPPRLPSGTCAMRSARFRR